MSLRLTCVDVGWRPPPHCKAIILQLKNKYKELIKLFLKNQHTIVDAWPFCPCQGQVTCRSGRQRL